MPIMIASPGRSPQGRPLLFILSFLSCILVLLLQSTAAAAAKTITIASRRSLVASPHHHHEEQVQKDHPQQQPEQQPPHLLRAGPPSASRPEVDPKVHLRICNAFPYPTAIDVKKGSTELTNEESLAYQDCGDYHLALKVGDKLQFLTSGIVRGQFLVSEVPEDQRLERMTLLLVVRRYDTESTTMAFSSHLFARSKDAQIAVIDAYQGPAKGILELLLNADQDTKSTVHFGTVITVPPGVYKARLVDLENEQRIISPSRFVAAPNETYVLLRTGVRADAGPNYKEDLFVFPRSSPFLLVGSHSGAQSAKSLAALSLMCGLLLLLVNAEQGVF
mmetsp:Transcript_14037/g.30474  ORF Transcript_14037/g.30474 Transcript_14037/m.30474 type:complete len:333 (+) Transcript_14037:176-1174(+)